MPADASRQKVTVVTTSWGNVNDERYFATRAYAGAATTVADVTIVHLTSSPAANPRLRDGAFGLAEVAATAGRPVEEAILLAALASADRSGRVPEVAGRGLHALEGGRSPELATRIGATAPEVLVVAGLNQGWPASMLDTLQPRPRLVVLPLMGDDPRLSAQGYRDFLRRADVVCATSPGERERVAAVVGSATEVVGSATEVVDLPLVVPMNTVAASHRLVGMSHFDNYVVILRGFPPGTVECPAFGGYWNLRRAVPGLGVADITNAEWRATSKGFGYTVPAGPSRVNLWRLLAQAIALIDLRPGGVLGREAIESLLIGTPVLVPSTSTSRRIVVESGGGHVYWDEDDLIEAVVALSDPKERAKVADRGREWALRVHGDRERFVADVTNSLVGAAAAAS
jgi:hypothetical protein